MKRVTSARNATDMDSCQTQSDEAGDPDKSRNPLMRLRLAQPA